MAAEEAGHGDADRLSALGQVSSPIPEVLDAARERLWAVVAAEILADGTPTDGAARRQGMGRADGAARQDDVTHGDGGARWDSAT